MFNRDSDNNFCISVGYILKNTKIYKIYIAEGLSVAGYILSPKLPGGGGGRRVLAIFFLGQEG